MFHAIAALSLAMRARFISLTITCGVGQMGSDTHRALQLEMPAESSD